MYPEIEENIVKECRQISRFSSSQNLLDLEHFVKKLFMKYRYDIKQGISDQRVKDLVYHILQIKMKDEVLKIQENMRNINKGNKQLHLQKLKDLKEVYEFNDADIMKISCWLTQVKRTAFSMDIEAPSALVFYSTEQRTGKSTFATMIKKAVLSSYQKKVHLVNFSIEEIFTRFRPMELIHDLVITIDEIGWMSKDITAQLKSMITDTREILIEEKYKKPLKAKKLANFIITANEDPADLFYSDAHVRRLSVIEHFHMKQKMTNEELFRVTNEIWQSTPVEYAFDTEKLTEMNLGRVRSNDEIFEALLKYYGQNNYGNGIRKGPYSREQLYNLFKDLGFDISKKLVISYLETTKEYFKISISGRTRRYYFEKKLLEDLEEAYKNVENTE